MPVYNKNNIYHLTVAARFINLYPAILTFVKQRNSAFISSLCSCLHSRSHIFDVSRKLRGSLPSLLPNIHCYYKSQTLTLVSYEIKT